MLYYIFYIFISLLSTLKRDAKKFLRKFKTINLFSKHLDKIKKNDILLKYAAMAQQVEHVLGKDEVTGPNPVSSSRKRRFRKKPSFFLIFSNFFATKPHFPTLY